MRIPKNAVNFKGTKDGIVAYIDLSYSFNTILKALEKKISEREDFFRGGSIKFFPITGSFSDREIFEIKSLMENKFDIDCEFFEKEEEVQLSAEKDKKMILRDFLVIKRILRSGQILNYSGNIILIGDVNEDAEIISGGSLFVFGSLRGSVIAGRDIGEDAIVVATNLRPKRLQIGDIVLDDDVSKRRKEVASIALVENGKIVIYPYKNLFVR
ncbi:MAG: hypothetical protein N3D74_00710 [Caldisericia bacterium]|nr:hypothetical protein [Caldisericia bacterium]